MKREPLYFWICLVLIGLVALTLRVWVRGPFLPHVDDALITYRYAENLATGLGFVYNEGARVQGTTTPLYTLLLAAMIKLGMDVFVASTIFNFLGAMTTIGIASVLLYNSGLRYGALVAPALLAITSHIVIWSVSGMETAIYTALILLTFYSYGSGRPHLALVLVALTILLRPDGVLIGVAVVVYDLLFARVIKLKHVLIPGILLSGWCVFSQLYFGSLVPNSVIAKGPSLRLGFVVQLLHPAVVVLIVPALWGVQRVWRARLEKMVLLAAWTLFYILAFCLAPGGFPWYVVPPVVGIIVLASVGLDHIVAWLIDRRFGKLIGITAIVGLILMEFIGCWIGGQHVRDALVNVELPRIQAGQWLAENTSSQAVVAAEAIGQIGFFSHRRILDVQGLISPEMLGHLHDLGYVISLEPDYIAGPWGGNIPGYEIVYIARPPGEGTSVYVHKRLEQ